MASLRTHKKWVRNRDYHQCQICGEILPVPFGRLEVHHIIYRCNDGSDEIKNLVTLCDLCHAVIHDHMGLHGLELVILRKKNKNRIN